MTDMIINSRKYVPSWTFYCGKLVSLLINRTISFYLFLYAQAHVAILNYFFDHIILI